MDVQKGGVTGQDAGTRGEGARTRGEGAGTRGRVEADEVTDVVHRFLKTHKCE